MCAMQSSTVYEPSVLYDGLLARLSGSPNPQTLFPSDEQRALESDWERWLTTLFPASVTAGFAPHHVEMWEWLWSIQAGIRPRPFVAAWPRGGGKSATAELGCVALGALGKRRYVLYVSGTQELADQHLASIAARMESRAVERYYPSLGARHFGKFGNPRGWRRNRVSTDAGFTIDSVGLDTATRGVKLEDLRPDTIVVDDVDHLHDTFAATEKKIATLTQSLLPAGSVDLAVLGAQNLVHPDSIFSRLAGVSQYQADFLQDRIMSGPFPAIEDLEIEYEDGKAVIAGGTPIWAGQGIAECQGFINSYGERAFRRESQQQVDLARGSKFRKEWFPIVDDWPRDARMVRRWDMAATEPKKPTDDPDWTAGCLMAFKGGRYWIVDMARFRTTPGGNKQRVKQHAEDDGRRVMVRMEQEPGSSGKTVIADFRELLSGWDFDGEPSTGSKELRANPLSSAAEAGNVMLVRGDWNRAFLEEAESFPSGAHDDQVDAASGALQDITTAAGPTANRFVASPPRAITQYQPR